MQCFTLQSRLGSGAQGTIVVDIVAAGVLVPDAIVVQDAPRAVHITIGVHVARLRGSAAAGASPPSLEACDCLSPYAVV